MYIIAKHVDPATQTQAEFKDLRDDRIFTSITQTSLNISEFESHFERTTLMKEE
jgi:hypothetical protein